MVDGRISEIGEGFGSAKGNLQWVDGRASIDYDEVLKFDQEKLSMVGRWPIRRDV
jgi:hypothetical protein